MGIKLNLVGQVFGLLTVTNYHGKTEDRMMRLWDCKCACGGDSVVPSTRLRKGITKSCGCLKSTVTASRNTSHGASRTPLYLLWSAMHSRCYNPNNGAYHRYGGRGITVDERWHSFELFALDVGEKPAGMSLDRIRNNEGYSAINFKWSTPTEQNSNRRDNVFLKMPDGEVVTKTGAERRIGVHRDKIVKLIVEHGSFQGVVLCPQISKK